MAVELDAQPALDEVQHLAAVVGVPDVEVGGRVGDVLVDLEALVVVGEHDPPDRRAGALARRHQRPSPARIDLHVAVPDSSGSSVDGATLEGLGDPVQRGDRRHRQAALDGAEERLAEPAAGGRARASRCRPPARAGADGPSELAPERVDGDGIGHRSAASSASNGGRMARRSVVVQPRRVDAGEAQRLDRRRRRGRRRRARRISSSATSTPNISALSELIVTRTPASSSSRTGMVGDRRRRCRSTTFDVGHTVSGMPPLDDPRPAAPDRRRRLTPWSMRSTPSVVDARCGCRRPGLPRRGASSCAGRAGGPRANSGRERRQVDAAPRRRRRRCRPARRDRTPAASSTQLGGGRRRRPACARR